MQGLQALDGGHPHDRIHLGVACDGCGDGRPLIGQVMKCSTCEDFDLCKKCYDGLDHSGHPADHRFYERYGSERHALQLAFMISHSLLRDMISNAAAESGTKPTTISEIHEPSAMRGGAAQREQCSASILPGLLCLLPLRKAKQAGIGATLVVSITMVHMAQNRFWNVCMITILCLACSLWACPLCAAVASALLEWPFESWWSFYDHILFQLCPQDTLEISPNQVLYSSGEVALEPRIGVLVCDPLPSYSITAFFHHGQLVSTDDSTLHSARLNGVASLHVSVLQPLEGPCANQLQPSLNVKVQTGPWTFMFAMALQPIVKLFNSIEEFWCDTEGVLSQESCDELAWSLLDNPLNVLSFQDLASWPGRPAFAEAHSTELESIMSTLLDNSLSDEAIQDVLLGSLDKMRRFLSLMDSIIEESNPPPKAGEAQLLSLVLPVAALTTSDPRPQGYVILEADKIVSTRPGRDETLYKLIKEKCPNLGVVQPEGDRHYARVRMPLADEAVVRAVIKSLAKERGKRSNVKVIERVYDSPRD